MNLTEAAKHLGMSPRTLRLAVERGEIEAQHPLPDGPWVFNRETLQTAAAATSASPAEIANPRYQIQTRQPVRRSDQAAIS